MTRIILAIVVSLAAVGAQAQYFPNFAVLPYCDGDTTFFRAVFIKNATTTIKVRDFGPDLSAYTASGNEVPGYCQDQRDSLVSPQARYFTTTTSGTVPAGLASWSLLNTGTANATVTFAAGSTVINGVTVPGGAQTIIPGQAIQCSAYADERNRLQRCPGLTLNATGTTVRVFLLP